MPGFPVDKVIATIDTENLHRQELESFVVRAEQSRLNKAQTWAQIVAACGVFGALAGGYFGVPSGICIVIGVLAVGGPPVATIAARLLDRFHVSGE